MVAVSLNAFLVALLIGAVAWDTRKERAFIERSHDADYLARLRRAGM